MRAPLSVFKSRAQQWLPEGCKQPRTALQTGDLRQVVQNLWFYPLNGTNDSQRLQGTPEDPSSYTDTDTCQVAGGSDGVVCTRACVACVCVCVCW